MTFTQKKKSGKFNCVGPTAHAHSRLHPEPEYTTNIPLIKITVLTKTVS